MKKVILIKYGELTTKKDNRNFFINKLKNNIFDKLSNYDFEIRDDYYRMFIFPNEDDIDGIVNILKNIFGIHEIVIAYMDEEVTEEAILKCSLDVMKSQKFKTFKVVTNRSDKKFPIKSMDMNNIVGGHILKNIECKVDVHNPDIYLNIEINLAKWQSWQQPLFKMLKQLLKTTWDLFLAKHLCLVIQVLAY